MKRLLLTLLTLVSLTTFAQDIIICRNGDEIQSKVLKISKTEVEYKKWTNQDGPAYTIEKAEVFMIKYQNGDKDVFKETPAAQPTTTEQQTAQAEEQAPNEPIMATPAANNAELIAEYNNAPKEYVLRYPGKNKKVIANYIQGVLGVTNSSILSTNDIEISFIKVERNSDYRIGGESIGNIADSYNLHTSKKNCKYAIMIKNKTSRVIYIDKAACFGNASTGRTKMYYDPTEYTVTSGGNSGKGVSVNMGSVADALGVGGAVGALAGGVNVGGDKGKFSATTTTYKDNRILTIPPQATVALSEDGIRENPANNQRIVTGSYECFDIPARHIYRDELKVFTEENTPKTINYMLTYSFNKNFNNSYITNFSVYLREIFGITYIWDGNYFRSFISPTSPKTIIVM